mmetsp:Transcript_61694/g.133664  ORF Transcript_61694/g.133664 Transcript_61694/m.133664 type:complete len:243 (-) Transcript_61694:639-1367(-)
MKPIALGDIPRCEGSDPLSTEATATALTEEAWKKPLGSSKAALGAEHVILPGLVNLLLATAACMVRTDPIDFAFQKFLPEILHVLPRTDGWIHLRMKRLAATAGIDIEEQVSNGHFATEVEVREDLCHLHRCLQSLLTSEVQEVDVLEVCLIRKVGGDEDCKAFRMLRPRGTVGVQTTQLALIHHLLGVGTEDVCDLAVERERHVHTITGHGREFPHDELEVGDVILVFRHQELLLAVRGTM